MKIISLKSQLNLTLSLLVINFFSCSAMAQIDGSRPIKRKYFIMINDAKLSFPLFKYHPDKFSYKLNIQSTAPSLENLTHLKNESQMNYGIVSPLRTNLSVKRAIRPVKQPKKNQRDYSGFLLAAYYLFLENRSSQ
jgi:hypothetical protein